MFSVMKTLFRALRVTLENIFGPVELFSIIMEKITGFSALSDFSSEQNFGLVKVYPSFSCVVGLKKFQLFRVTENVIFKSHISPFYFWYCKLVESFLNSAPQKLHFRHYYDAEMNKPGPPKSAPR